MSEVHSYDISDLAVVIQNINLQITFMMISFSCLMSTETVTITCSGQVYYYDVILTLTRPKLYVNMILDKTWTYSHNFKPGYHYTGSLTAHCSVSVIYLTLFISCMKAIDNCFPTRYHISSVKVQWFGR